MTIKDAIQIHIIQGIHPGIIKRIVRILLPYISMTPYIHGEPKSRCRIHPSVQCANTLFNVASGEITVDENTLFSHNVMVITGRHTMGVGKKGEFQDTVPHIGYDIHIGKRCWICSGVIISGGVTIGDDCIIAAGSIVVHNVPAGSFVKGVH